MFELLVSGYTFYAHSSILRNIDVLFLLYDFRIYGFNLYRIDLVSEYVVYAYFSILRFIEV